MRLSKRIYALANKITAGETAADIGTDHGYVPMLLMKNGISPAVIMSDISEGSLAKARETFRMCGLDAPESAFRIGDGLSTIESGETDAVIIAGLGGHTIAEILGADPDKSKSFSKLVLQPRKHSGTLRYFLYTNGWDIVSEDLAPEGKFVCEIITAVPAADSHREPPYAEDDIRWKYPSGIMTSDKSLAAERIMWKIGSIREELDNLSRSSRDNTVLTARLNEELSYLTALLDSTETNEKA